MIDHNDKMRMSDEELQQYADDVLWDYRMNTEHGVYTMPKTPLVVRELVLRELERRKKEDRGDGDDRQGKGGCSGKGI